MRLTHWVLLALALVTLWARASAQVEEVEEEEEEVVADEPAGPAGGFGAPGEHPAMTEEQERQAQQQQAVIQHILATVGTECRDELIGLLRSTPEEQAKTPLSEPCRAEVQAAVQQLQEQQGGAPGGEAGAEGGAGGAEGAGPRRPKKSTEPVAWGIVLQVLGFVTAALAGVGGYVYYLHLQREQFLKDHPEEARRLKVAAERRAKKASKRGASADAAGDE